MRFEDLHLITKRTVLKDNNPGIIYSTLVIQGAASHPKLVNGQ